MTETNYIWILMARELSGETTEEESASLNELLSNNPALHQQFQMMQKLWKQKHEIPPGIQFNVNKIIQLSNSQEIIDQAFPKRNHRRRIISFLTGAAAVVIAAILIFRGSNTESLPSEESVKLATADNGTRSRTILPDGSSVWLNAGSSLKYDKFEGELREVFLEGEAYFSVVENKEKPFIVHAGGINIKVLGTTFNVKSYPEDSNVETTLIQGSVEIIGGDQKPIKLQAFQKISLAKKDDVDQSVEQISLPRSSDKVSLVNLDSAVKTTELIETAWIYNRLVFRGDDFATLSRKLERWYNVRITLTDDSVKGIRFNGSFENETIEQALQALQLVVPFDYKIKENEIFISSPGI